MQSNVFQQKYPFVATTGITYLFFRSDTTNIKRCLESVYPQVFHFGCRQIGRIDGLIGFVGCPQRGAIGGIDT